MYVSISISAAAYLHRSSYNISFYFALLPFILFLSLLISFPFLLFLSSSLLTSLHPSHLLLFPSLPSSSFHSLSLSSHLLPFPSSSLAGDDVERGYRRSETNKKRTTEKAKRRRGDSQCREKTAPGEHSTDSTLVLFCFSSIPFSSLLFFSTCSSPLLLLFIS